MLKAKIIAVVGIVIGVLGLSTGAFLVWHNQHHVVRPSTALDSSVQSAPENTGDSTTDTASGLSVGSAASAGSLGQLSPSQNQNQSSSQNSSSTTGSSASSSASSTSASQALNPATFGQYNDPKYLNASAAFFGDLQVGTGPAITAGQKVAVYYKGWLTNGQLFDETKTNSSGQMQPFDFTYGANPSQVITGWEEGITGMKVGGVRLLIIPPSVGYGTTGQGAIPPNSVLIFEVQLVAAQ